ncbi:hypothetical protein ACFFV7_51015 [Nonomuraea spiralis]|uniref:MYM-type domain-containing protein n=1 Tax=Nonomuraea spiralis TaxID=46182 RepID=A0ABV5IYH9_9ACTN|nr:hypothetical protein [Nonomuraea spiralis]
MMVCTHCGLPLTGGTAMWMWSDDLDRDPFCSDECMAAELTFRELAETHVRP